MAEWPSSEIRSAWPASSGELSLRTFGKPSSAVSTSTITARNAGSSAVSVGCWISTISPCSSEWFGKPASMILSAVRASPTLDSDASRYVVPTVLPM